MPSAQPKTLERFAPSVGWGRSYMRKDLAGDLVAGVITAILPVLAFLAGLFLLVLGVLRLGFLANFLSHPVLSGLTSGAAVIIILSKVPNLLGIRVPSDVPSLEMPLALAEAVRNIDPATLALGIFSVGLLLLAGKPLARVLTVIGVLAGRARVINKIAPLAVVLITTLLVTHFALDTARGVAVVGALPTGLPRIGFAVLGFETLTDEAVEVLAGPGLEPR